MGRLVSVRLQKNLFQTFGRQLSGGGIDGRTDSGGIRIGNGGDESEFFHGTGDFSRGVGNEVSGIRNFRGKARGFFEGNVFHESFDPTDGLLERNEILIRMIGADVREDRPNGFGRNGFWSDGGRGIRNGNRNTGCRNGRSGCRHGRTHRKGFRRFRCRNRQYRGHGNPYRESDGGGIFLDSERTEQSVDGEKRSRSGHSRADDRDSSGYGKRS